MGDFQTQSVAFGYSYYDFLQFSDDDKEKIVRLLARISEQSFRRGFQQGCHMQARGKVAIKPEVWRFDAPVDDSQDPESPHGRSSTIRDRLFENYPVLSDLGL